VASGAGQKNISAFLLKISAHVAIIRDEVESSGVLAGGIESGRPKQSGNLK
jgi:hypothetical protein